VLLEVCVATKDVSQAVALHRHLVSCDRFDVAATAKHFALLIDCCFAANRPDSAFQVHDSGSVPTVI
jgi:hypothetical protein